MPDERDILFALLRAALDARQAEGLDTVDTSMWWRVFRLVQQNHVAALMAGALPDGVPRDVLMPWLAESERARNRYRFQCDVQRQVVDTMTVHGIETLVLKGTHTAQYYPEAEVRQFGDLDLYFFDRHDEADEVARRELHVQVDNHSHHHTRYELRGITIESHYDFVNTHYPPSNRRYEAMLKELAPSPTFEVLFLLRHMAGHFAASRITLRDVCDWVLTRRALGDKVDWICVQRVAQEYGMTPFLEAMETLSNGDATDARFVDNAVYGDIRDHKGENMGRLLWKMRRWRANAWKRRMVYNDSPARLLLSSLVAHGMKPQSILHKM